MTNELKLTDSVPKSARRYRKLGFFAGSLIKKEQFLICRNLL